MPLAKHLAHDFESAVKNRGRSYFLNDVVRITSGGAWAVSASVRGTRTYRVELGRSDDEIVVSCTCPYFEDVAPCKHLWATILAADAQGHLVGDGDDRRVRLVEDRASEWDDDDEEEEEESEEEPPPKLRPAARPAVPAAGSRSSASPPPAHWKEPLAALKTAAPRRAEAWPAGRELLYFIDVEATRAGKGLVVEVAYRERKMGGEWGKPRAQRLSRLQIPTLPDPADRQILALLAGATEHYVGGYAPNAYYGSAGYGDSIPFRYQLLSPLAEVFVPMMCRAGRCRLRVSPEQEEPLAWDAGGAWEFYLEVRGSQPPGHYEVTGALRRGGERKDLGEPILLVDDGLVFNQGSAALLDHHGSFPWIVLLRRSAKLLVPADQRDELLTEILRQPAVPRLELPEELRYTEVAVPPRPRLMMKPPGGVNWGRDWLRGDLSFDYEGAVVPVGDPGGGVYQGETRRWLVRDRAAEHDAAARLRGLGFRQTSPTYYDPEPRLELAPRHLPLVVRTLVGEGWHVEAEGRLFRRPGSFRLEVSSGVDWFELHGELNFGEASARLPELLAALKRGENVVRLGDGSFGMIPEDWLQKYGLLAGLGEVRPDHLRFSRAQVGLLDALLAAQPEANFDAAFARAREELRRFAGVEPAAPPAGFVGQLRDYQREGLGWIHFLRQFGFGGCLADDMGTGKTIQVLALLEARRELRERARKKRGRRGAGAGKSLASPGPSLVVVPKSLGFNWKQEAARFTPGLRVLDHTGAERLKPGGHFDEYDLVLTTYGTLRRDAADFKDVRFDYVILDEAQAIKNASSASAKAARLLRGDHRLALSGTPVENHLGELWSLFEFLNPGMLGAASVFKLTGAGARTPDAETRGLLARALRPFILRRTKDQVARELAPKLEQTLYCEMEPKQLRLYRELRDHYRQTLLGRVERDGIGRSKIHVLEALLRLRQAACHPGLIDKKRASEPSAKLDMLLEQLAEALGGGHKVLVFSQFTSLLAIVRERLDRDQVPYEYLDGRTRDRAAKVGRFQEDAGCKLFLISLKAGGLGLNLTAAEYVFLLDPWWNPAVEAQAIDRAHRIGQERQVFAYRLIARGTVEEKVLELQQTKRALADAIIGADNSLIRDLKREDLELLLS